jgi:hypothetical protein
MTPKNRNNNRRLAYLALLFLLFLSSAFSVLAFADYQDGFEQYPVGSSSPLIIPPNNQGWVFSNGGCANLVAYTVNQWVGLQPYQGNEMYTIFSLSPCTSLATISINLIATSSSVSIALEGRENSSLLQLKLIFYGITWTYSTTSNAWVKLSTTAGTQKGVVYQLQLGCQYPQGSGSEGQCFFDSVNVTGADIWNYPTNFQMVDWLNKPFLYNLVGYGGTSSSLVVNYTSQVSYNAANLTAPDLCLPIIIGGSGCQAAPSPPTLITVWVGNLYYRTIIPNPTGNTTMYLDPPQRVLPYVFSIEDFTGEFGHGSVVQVSTGGLVITSGYADANEQFSTFLVPGTYTVLISNNGNSFSTIVSLGAASNLVTIPIFKVNLKSGSGFLTAIQWSTGWAGNNLLMSYQDSTGTTSNIWYRLLKENASGTFVIFNQNYTGSFGSFQNSVPSNSSIANQLYVELVVTDKFGKSQLGPSPAAVGVLFPQAPNFPGDVGALDIVVPGAGIWTEIFALVVLIVFAGIFGYRSSPFGFIAVSMMAALFGFAGWIALVPSLLAVLITIAMAAFLIHKEKAAGY